MFVEEGFLDNETCKAETRPHATPPFSLALSVIASASPADVPVFEITPVASTVKFDVESSVSIVGKVFQVGCQAHVHQS
jgi:hypothetical protein